MALWPVAAAAAEDGGPGGGWLMAAAGGGIAALAVAAAMWLYLRRRIAWTRLITELLGQLAQGAWLWPVNRQGRQADSGQGPDGRCAPALAEALGLPPDAGWERFLERLPEARDRVICVLRFFLGLPLEKIAERLRLDQAEVRERYRLAVLRLERELRPWL